ncbi:hypothetical protein ACE1ET_20400, partial [Saccharicrinis sp. FJH62]|uniref:hypothetical protein n=1 Tax=Saccharicrinis sp. FJH62 TaxID=3344657 RepID=UPI0035D45541
MTILKSVNNRISHTIMILFLIITSCNTKTKSSSKDLEQINKKYVRNNSKSDTLKNNTTVKFIDNKFKYSHIKKFIPHTYQYNGLKQIDSLFYSKIIQQIESFGYSQYDPSIKNY